MKNYITSMNDQMELLTDPERVMEGLRDTGYTFNTAMADIIDNSISAHATKIDIRVIPDPNMNITVYIADNGIGMDQKSLENAMRYGSQRREKKDSLGKFGLGLKTASTAYCRCLSLVSRVKDDDTVRKVQWDLDHIAKENK
jgi:signal transduction histidine kinase